MLRSLLFRALGSLLLVAATACGAGVIVGIAASNRGRTESAPPVIAVFNPTAPLVGPTLQLRGLFVNNFTIPSGAALSVEMSALGATSIQAQPVVLSTRATGADIAFFERHDEILVQLSPTEVTQSDVVASLSFLVDGRPIGGTVPFTLIRQRVATLAPLSGAASQEFLSVLGTSRVRLRLTGRAPGETLEGPGLLIGVEGGFTQRATAVQTGRVAGSVDWLVSGVAPANLYPARVSVRAQDDAAGWSTVVSEVFYRPAILAGAPHFGVVDGGTLLVVLGQGLAPLSVPTDPTSAPNFAKVRLLLKKGGRELQVPASALRIGQSSLRQLVFTTTPSPDGRPGPAAVALGVDLEGVEAADEVADLFVYQRAAPGFGPRGALLESAPSATAFAPVLAASEAADAIVLFAVSGTPHVELLQAEGNGMLSTFGAPWLAGSPTDPRQQAPVSSCAAEMNGDGQLDVLVLNRGTAPTAIHTLLLGQAAPAPPLALASAGVVAASGARRCRSADLDGDGVSDLVVLPEASTSRGPELFLSRPAAGQPGFVAVSIGGQLAQRAPYDALALEDLDGDGAIDIACVRAAGTAAIDLVVGYGDGSGGVAQQQVTSITIPGYTASLVSTAVGLHALRGAPTRALALVLEGDPLSAATPPAVVALRPQAPRVYAAPGAGDVVLLPSLQRLVASTVGDLDGGPTDEVVVGAADGVTPALRVLQWDGTAFVEVAGGVADSLEPLQGIRALQIAIAAPADSARSTPAVSALFVEHDLLTAGGLEPRITTWLAAPGPRLLAPDASLEVPAPLTGCALGNFVGGGGKARDLMLLTPSALRLWTNDGLGTFTAAQSVAVANALPGSLCPLPMGPWAPGVDAVAFLQSDGQLGVLVPGDVAPRRSGVDLRRHATSAGWNLTPSSRLVAGDVDGDGVVDLVAALVLEDPALPANQETVLLLLRGDAGALPGALPFILPASSAPVVRRA